MNLPTFRDWLYTEKGETVDSGYLVVSADTWDEYQMYLYNREMECGSDND